MKKLKLMMAIICSAVATNAQSLYDFNSPNQLSTFFEKSGTSTNITQTTTGGVSNSGAINVSGSSNEVYTTKQGYSNGGVGSIYTFSTYFKSEGNSGYGGIGFTNQVGNPKGTYANPTIGIGISVHGGGYEWTNNNQNVSGSWRNTPAATGEKQATETDLLNNGSADKWYKVILRIEAKANNVYDCTVEVYPSSSTGILLNDGVASAIRKATFTNSNLGTASTLHSYFAFSGYRITYFDDYGISLVGSSVIDEGAPVVSGTALLSGSTINMNGNASDDRNSPITEKGFVWNKTGDPTTSHNKVMSNQTGEGTFTTSITGLTSGTYYIRAYAINGMGTSYGETQAIQYEGTLAATLVSFTANKEENSVLLKWTTHNENETKNYRVSRSTDGLNFELLATINPKKSTVNNYTLVDNKPASGNNYYLIEDFDYNGTKTVLSVKSVNFSLNNNQSTVSVYPNPTVNKVTVQFQPQTYQKAMLLSMNGQILEQKEINLKDQSVEFNLELLTNGIYFVQLNGSTTNTQKVIKR